RAVRRSSKGRAGALRPSPHSRSVPGYGRDPVGKGHAAAGLSAVLALSVDGLAVTAAELALGLAGRSFFFFFAFFFLPATLLVAFFLDDFFFFDAFFFFFFLPPFFPFFFAIPISFKGSCDGKPASCDANYSSAARKPPDALNSSLATPCREILIQDIRIKAYSAFPRHLGGLRVYAHLLELAHVAPELECADLEQVAEEDAAFQSVVETDPELVVFFGFAGGHFMHVRFVL